MARICAIALCCLAMLIVAGSGNKRAAALSFVPVVHNHDLVFVIDSSGSMVINDAGQRRLVAAKQQMRVVIARNLSERQNFHIIFFADGEPQEMEGGGLVPATDDNKTRAVEFLDALPRTTTGKLQRHELARAPVVAEERV